MPVRGEEPTVVLVDVERGIPAVDDPEERSQLVEEVVRPGAEDATVLDVLGELTTLASEAVGVVVNVADREETTIFGVEAEQHAVEDDERVVEGLRERLIGAFVVA